MTPDQFDEFIWETIPQQLFHVSDNDKDDTYGVCLSEYLLIQIINDNIECLKYKPLKWFIDTYVPDAHKINRIM